MDQLFFNLSLFLHQFSTDTQRYNGSSEKNEDYRHSLYLRFNYWHNHSDETTLHRRKKLCSKCHRRSNNTGIIVLEIFSFYMDVDVNNLITIR